MRPGASGGAAASASWPPGSRRETGSPNRGRRPAGSYQACDPHLLEKGREGVRLILSAERPPQQVRLRPPEGVHPPGLQVAKLYHSGREQEWVDFIKVAVVALEDLRERG